MCTANLSSKRKFKLRHAGKKATRSFCGSKNGKTASASIFEQSGKRDGPCGTFHALSRKLTEGLGRRYSPANLFSMARFVEVFPDAKIVHALRGQLAGLTPSTATPALQACPRRASGCISCGQ
jgi:hypothetical protein